MSRRSRDIAAQAAQQASNAASAAQNQSAQQESLPLAQSNREQSASDSALPQPKATEFIRPAPRNEPRRLAMEEIENRDLKEKGVTRERAAEDVAIVEATDDKPKEAAKPDASTPEPAETTLAQVEENNSNQQVTTEEVDVAAPVPMTKVKVDGQEMDVPTADIEAAGGVTTYQKMKAADNRLAKAQQALAETRQTQAQMVEWIKQQTQGGQPAQSPQQAITDDQFIASRVDVIRFGTPEESATALQQIMERNRVDQSALIRNAVTTMQRETAIDNFKKEFQDVASNPLLLRLAISLENELVPKMPANADWGNFYRTIGNQVRSVRGVSGQPSQPAGNKTSDTTSQSPSEKEARKASIVNIPTAAARASLPESKPETREDTLNSMRKSRGLPVG